MAESFDDNFPLFVCAKCVGLMEDKSLTLVAPCCTCFRRVACIACGSQEVVSWNGAAASAAAQHAQEVRSSGRTRQRAAQTVRRKTTTGGLF